MHAGARLRYGGVMTNGAARHERTGLGDPALPVGALGRLLLLHRDRARERRAVHSGADPGGARRRLALGLLLVARRSGWRCRRARLRPFWCWPCSTTSIPFVLFAWAQEEITGGLASILNATTPIWGVLVAHLFTADEKATPGKVAGVLLGFAGVAVMIGADLLGQIGPSASPSSPAWLATLCYALAGV